MLHLLPRPQDLPTLGAILEDLGHPSPDTWGPALGLSARTAYRHQQAGAAPRAETLALFWVTRWGLSVIDCAAVNDARLADQARAAAEREAGALRRELARVLAVADFGAANAPTIRQAIARPIGA